MISRIGKRWFVCCLVALFAMPLAMANPEAPGMYDAKNHGMGGAGVAHIDTPVAIFHNPANLANTRDAQYQGNLTALIVQLSGSFAGADAVQETDWLPVPLPFLGFNQRVSPQVTLGGAFYFALGFGGGYEDVKQYGTGQPCTRELADAFKSDGQGEWLFDGVALNNDFCIDKGREEYVGLAIFEAALPISYRVTADLKVGASLRFPFGLFEQKTTEDIWGAFIDNNHPTGSYGLGYTQVKSQMYGYGKPGFLFGITYDVFPFLSVAATYRTEITVTMQGKTDLILDSNLLLQPALDGFGNLPIGLLQGLISDIPEFGELLELRPGDSLNQFVGRIASDIDSEIEWSIPRAVELGFALNATPNLLLAVDWRHQYHSESNKMFLVKLKEPLFEKSGLDSLGQTLAWKDVYMWSFGAEYSFSDSVKFRMGYSVGNSATPEAYTNPFTPPPADKQDSYYLGVGFVENHWETDIGLSYARVVNEIEQEEERSFNATCQPGQLVKSGCPGDQRVTSIFLSLSLNYRY